jgi:hypothetical protein
MNCTPWKTTSTLSRPPSQARALRESPWNWQAPHTALETLASSFAPISLKQMGAVALLNRWDTKFVVSAGQLLRALAELNRDYWMLSIGSQRLNPYRTLYFDTPDFELYHAHVNERAERYKVRCREYTGSSLSFMEVKHKTRKGRTIKARLRTAQPVIQMTPEIRYWVGGVSPLEGDALEPKLWNTFKRLTLVSKHRCERVTLDVDLTLYFAGKEMALEGLAIAEVKLDTHTQASPFLAQMRAQRIGPRGFSKYSLGVSWLYDHVKHNTLKPQRRWIEKMMKGAMDNE